MAYQNDRHLSYYSSPSSFHQQVGGEGISYDNSYDLDRYESDEFCMYTYKIKKCTNLHNHNWTSCPFVHRGEKARRRDPREHKYLPIPCPGYKFASCIKGDNCELCHGVFEYWLHPAKYRTQPCHYGTSCDRQVCFFAHTLKEIRPETKYNWCYVYQYPLHIQPYPDILIENEPNGTWTIIPCNHPLSPLPPLPDDQCYGATSFEVGTSSTDQLIPQNNISPQSSSQSQPRTYQMIQNESDFSLFSVNHARLIEELKNLQIGSTSHSKENKIDDEKGKRPIEFDS